MFSSLPQETTGYPIFTVFSIRLWKTVNLFCFRSLI